jgi:hypothetical protein
LVLGVAVTLVVAEIGPMASMLMRANPSRC